MDMTDTLAEPPSHVLQLQEQAQDVVAETDAVLETSPSVAPDREVPFGSRKQGLGVPLAFPGNVGTQGKSRICAHSLDSPTLSGSGRRGEAERRGLGHR
eukprot:5651996-Pleurochrysis_carterae.AAC.1